MYASIPSLAMFILFLCLAVYVIIRAKKNGGMSNQAYVVKILVVGAIAFFVLGVASIPELSRAESKSEPMLGIVSRVTSVPAFDDGEIRKFTTVEITYDNKSFIPFQGNEAIPFDQSDPFEIGDRVQVSIVEIGPGNLQVVARKYHEPKVANADPKP